MTQETNNEKIATIKIEGRGHGFEYNAIVGEIRFKKENNNMLRVWIGKDNKGLAISSLGFPRVFEPIRAEIVKGGELRWSKDILGVIETRFLVLNQLAALRENCLQSYRALIPVSSAGSVEGSILAGRVKIRLASGKALTRVVPASQVEAHNGKLWIPRWLAIEKTEMRHFAGVARLPEEVERGFDELMNAYERNIQLLILEATPYQEAEIIEAPIRQKREEEERRVTAERKEAEAKKAELVRVKLEEQAKRRRAKALEKMRERDATIEPIHNATVTWFVDEGTKKWPKVVFRTEKKCTLRMRGQYIYITLPDGTELKRQPQTVEIIVDGKPITGAESLIRAREWAGINRRRYR